MIIIFVETIKNKMKKLLTLDYFIDFEFNKRRMRLAREKIDIFFKND